MTKDTVIIWDSGKIRQGRGDRGFSPDEAASLLEITPVYLGMLEKGVRQPSPRMLTRLARVYRKPISFFLVDEKNMVPA